MTADGAVHLVVDGSGRGQVAWHRSGQLVAATVASAGRGRRCKTVHAQEAEREYDRQPTVEESSRRGHEGIVPN